jgi:hypothetical protein
MSAFIKLNKQDAFVVPYTAYKTWTLPSASLDSYNIELFTAEATGSYSGIFNPTLSSTSGVNSTQYNELVYRSLKHLYYSGVHTGAESSSSFEDYKQTTLFPSMSRIISEDMLMVSLPRNLIGSSLKPGTFAISNEANISAYVSGGYILTGYFVGPTSSSFLMYDDGEGNLMLSGSNSKIGDIIYPHGHLILTNSASISTLRSATNYQVHWQSTYEVYTHNYRCRVREQDLNYSQNPSIKSGSNGDTYDFATGSYFQPYVTTVGLYNDSNELIAVGKLGQPVPKSRYSDMTFVLNLDI